MPDTSSGHKHKWQLAHYDDWHNNAVFVCECGKRKYIKELMG